MYKYILLIAENDLSRPSSLTADNASIYNIYLDSNISTPIALDNKSHVSDLENESKKSLETSPPQIIKRLPPPRQSIPSSGSIICHSDANVEDNLSLIRDLCNTKGYATDSQINTPLREQKSDTKVYYKNIL